MTIEELINMLKYASQEKCNLSTNVFLADGKELNCIVQTVSIVETYPPHTAKTITAIILKHEEG